MKEFFMMLAVVAVILVFNNFAEAKALTHENIDTVMNYMGQHPAAQPESTKVLNVDAAQLKSRYNANLEPILTQAQFDNEETRAAMEKLFYIEDFQVFNAEEASLYMNVFGDSVAILGVTSNDDPRFKMLTCSYTMPENKNDDTLSSLILVSFVKSIIPVADVESFLREVTGAQAAGLVRDGVKFNVGRDGDLIVVTAVAE